MKGVSIPTFKTPDVPHWIQAIEHWDYKNIYSYGLGNKNLWGTETLFGDWDGEFLLVAQDFCPTSYIDARLHSEPHPYHHNPDAPTNKNLLKTFSYFGRLLPDTSSIDRNALYVSACFLLRADGKKRGALRHKHSVLGVSAPVLRFTVEHMPHLKVVVGMGRVAAEALGLSKTREAIESRGLRCVRVDHPANAVSDEMRFAQWKSVFES